MASPAKADSVPGSTNPPDALQLAAADVDNLGLTVTLPTGPLHVDPTVIPPSPVTDQALVIVTDDPKDVTVAKPSTFTCRYDSGLVKKFTIATKLIGIDSLTWDFDMKHGQIRKLNGRLWLKIMNSFGMNPPMQPGNVVVLEGLGLPTPVPST